MANNAHPLPKRVLFIKVIVSILDRKFEGYLDSAGFLVKSNDSAVGRKQGESESVKNEDLTPRPCSEKW